MANTERTGSRDMAYSKWHRQLGNDKLGLIDIDWVEFCSTCYKILAVYELTADGPNVADKKCWITKKIADALGTKGYLVAYKKERGTITEFRVRPLAPRESDKFTSFTPSEWADQVYAFRWCHPLTRQDETPRAVAGHVCGWAEVDGVWTCIQDHYSVGFQPETSCGKTWAPA